MTVRAECSPSTYTSTSNIPSLACPAQLSATQCSEARGYLAGLVGSYPRTGINDIGFGKLDYQINLNNRLEHGL